MKIKRAIIITGIMVFLLAGHALADNTVTIPIGQNTDGSGQTQPPQAGIPAAMTGAAQSQQDEDIRDITAPIPIPDHIRYLWYAAGGLLIIILGLLLLRKLRSRTVENAESAHEKAVRLLSEARILIKPETAKEYSTAVSHAMREYMEAQFNMETLSLTTNEFLSRLKTSPPPGVGSHTKRLEAFLNHCDLAKFAGFSLTLQNMQEMHANALKFVDETSEPAIERGGKR